MSDAILIRIDAENRLAWQYPARHEQGEGAPSGALLAAADRVAVVVPGEAVLLTRIALPPGSPGRLRQMLPYALEDQLLDDVETLHFAAGPRAADGQHDVAVVARDKMQAWSALLAEADIEADILLPDVLAVPRADDANVALPDGERCLVRQGPAQGFVCCTGELAEWLAEPESTSLLVPGDRPDQELAANWPGPSRSLVSVAAALADGLDDLPELNLLCGDFAARHRQAPRRRLWRVAAILAGLAIVFGLAGEGVSVVRLQQANAQAEQAIQQRYASLFPDSPPVPDPVARVRSALKQAGGGDQRQGLLGMLSQAAPILTSQGYQFRMLGLEYRNHVLEMSVHAADLAGLDRLRERLATLPDVQVELKAATPDDDGVSGRLSVQESGT